MSVIGHMFQEEIMMHFIHRNRILSIGILVFLVWVLGWLMLALWTKPRDWATWKELMLWPVLLILVLVKGIDIG
jgi:hypothetical protein